MGIAHATATGMPLLTEEYSYSHYLFNIGHRGARKLINIHYKQQHYDDSDFRMILKVEHGFECLFICHLLLLVCLGFCFSFVSCLFLCYFCICILFVGLLVCLFVCLFESNSKPGFDFDGS